MIQTFRDESLGYFIRNERSQQAKVLPEGKGSRTDPGRRSQECQPRALTRDRHRLGGGVSSHFPPFLVFMHMCVYRKYVYMHTHMHTCTCVYESAPTHAGLPLFFCFQYLLALSWQ